MKSTILFIQGIFLSTALAFTSIQTHAATVNDSTSPNASMAQKLTLDQENKQVGERFMIDNQSKANVVTLPSGLQYQILEAGTGKKPSINDTVKVHYEGKLLNGQVFDSSYQRNQPATFPVSGVITGWQEALQLMNEGSTWMLYIPPSLAYGQRGAGTMIGPNETLVFKVQLISIQPN